MSKQRVGILHPGQMGVVVAETLRNSGQEVCWASEGRSTYNSLQLDLNRRFSGGLSIRGVYTLAKAMDNTSAFLATDGDDNTPQDSRNLAAEWGPSDRKSVV